MRCVFRFFTAVPRLLAASEFARQAIDHGRLVAVASRSDQPANGQAPAALRTNVDRDLVCRTTNAAQRTSMRRDVLERLVEDRYGVLAGLLVDLASTRAIHDALGNRLAVIHDGIRTGYDVAELRVRLISRFRLCDGGTFIVSSSDQRWAYFLTLGAVLNARFGSDTLVSARRE